MKKPIKIVLIVVASLVVLAGIFAIVGSIGLKETMNLSIASVNLTEIEDGVYVGDYENGRWSNTVEVTVSDHRITAIRHIGDGSADGREELRQQIIQQIIEQQRIDIDTVSGATATTKSFLKAVEDALYISD